MKKSILFLCLSATVPAGAAERRQAQLDTAYQGAHQATFTQEVERVRLLTRQSQLETSARLGLLQYRDGFQYPIRIRFDDTVPAGLESALAYVRFGQLGDSFAQELVVNMSLIEQSPFEFDQVFQHEMTHVVLNDAVGGEASAKVPHWVQEGLAQYVSGEGEERVRLAARSVRRSQAEALLCDLNGTVEGRCYPQYFLAIQYLFDRHSSNAVQMLVRNLINGQTLDAAVQDTLNRSVSRFEEDVRAYSLARFQDLASPD